MKRLMFLIVLAFIGFIFVGCSDMNQDIMSSGSTVDKIPKPFWGNWEGMTYQDTNISPTYRRIECQGNCLHMGLFTAEVTFYLTYNDPNYPPNPLLGGSLTNGMATMTAANGDKVYATITGEWWVGSYTNPMIYLTGDGNITGGTGRFDGASGSWSGTGKQNYYGPGMDPQEIWYTWETGQILY